MAEEQDEIPEAPLRSLLLQYIGVEEEVRELYKKILKRVSIIYFSLSFTVALITSTVLYFILQPVSENERLLTHINQLNEITLQQSKNILMQRRYDSSDRADIAVARKQFISILPMFDSLKKESDSLETFKFKKIMK